MALTPSVMLALGTPATDFALPDTVSGKTLTRDQCRGEAGLLVMFICNHCPYVLHIEDALKDFADRYRDSAVGIVAISANDVTDYPDDHPDKMRQKALETGFSFPYLYDESQQTAKAYCAACTPDFFLFDSDLKCAYRGRFDASRPGSGIPVTGEELSAAVDAVLAGQKPSTEQIPSMGCNIKWKRE